MLNQCENEKKSVGLQGVHQFYLRLFLQEFMSTYYSCGKTWTEYISFLFSFHINNVVIHRNFILTNALAE